jgi:hypothetical protein
MLGVLIGVEEKEMNKNVEYYLEDGCVFVQGDYCVDKYNGDVYGDGSWTVYADDGECDFHENEVTKFTWRNSTGTPPTYTNLVEVMQRNGTVYVDYVKNIDFTLELSEDDVVQWKPYIECELDWVVDIPMNIKLFKNIPVYVANINKYHIIKTGE